jgi:polyphosphate kinase
MEDYGVRRVCCWDRMAQIELKCGTSVSPCLEAAARDPDVLAIKSTLYRTSNNSPIISALIRAADKGKQVAVLVELKARFDEARNVDFAQKLESAGCNLAYGIKVGAYTRPLFGSI